MSNRKNYNSILFLTVYLGLVLVGATPQVMVYAATNSLFDLRNEIEFKEDLDNQPDDETCSALERNAKAQLIPLDLSLDLSLTFAKYTNFTAHSLNRALEKKGQKPGSYSYENERFYSGLDKSWCEWVSSHISSACDNLFDPAFPSFYRQKRKSKVTESFQLDDSGVTVKFTFNFNSADHSRSFASAYLSSLNFQRCKSQNFAEKVIYENTKVTSQNNQVLIVTRLPRASIDSLLK